jgi:glycosyltransferase involved in cell wall biosynthesis
MLKYSAILTTYNAEKSIILALDSILEQEISPTDIVIIDDCSSDATFSIASRYQSHTSQIRPFQNSRNLGVSFSRNFAIDNAIEDVIIFFDDDDVSMKHRAVVHLNHFSLGADVSYVSSSKKYLNGYSVQNISDDYMGFLDPSDLARRQLLGDKENLLATPASCMAISRKIAFKIGGFDSGLRRLEDADFAIALASKNAKFAFSSQICVERFDLGKVLSEYEGTSQMKILHKHRNLLSDREFHDAVFKSQARDLYFNRKFFRLFLRILKEVQVNPSQISYLITGFKRVKHDWSKK